MSQFEFLVMIEKKIFTYKVFLSLNILDFNLFFMWQLQTPWKKSPHLFSQEPPSESWGPVKAPLFENLVGGSTPRLLMQKVGVPTMGAGSGLLISMLGKLN